MNLPTLEDIIRQQASGECTGDQALAWLAEHERLLMAALDEDETLQLRRRQRVEVEAARFRSELPALPSFPPLRPDATSGEVAYRFEVPTHERATDLMLKAQESNELSMMNCLVAAVGTVIQNRAGGLELALCQLAGLVAYWLEELPNLPDEKPRAREPRLGEPGNRLWPRSELDYLTWDEYSRTPDRDYWARIRRAMLNPNRTQQRIIFDETPNGVRRRPVLPNQDEVDDWFRRALSPKTQAALEDIRIQFERASLPDGVDYSFDELARRVKQHNDAERASREAAAGREVIERETDAQRKK